MSSSLATDVARHHEMPTVDAASVDAVLAAAADRVVVLFFRGDLARWPETADLAVVLPQLIKAFPGRLTAAIVAAEAERDLMRRFGVSVCPSLALVRPGRTLGVIPKIQDWSSYVARITAMLADDDLRAATPELQK
uniref:Hydrogenase expression/formation protein n=1 Tax=Rhodopseudomonas palustris (strain BisA53) TaxID=316055 RepID=Q07S96_RHOP5